MFENGKMHGKGLLKWPGGATYEGDFFNGSPEGYGTKKYPDGRIYKGGFKDGNFHGEGQLELDGISEIGVWKNGEIVQLIKGIVQSTGIIRN